MNYTEYRQHMENLVFEKNKLLKIAIERRKIKGKYRALYKQHCYPLDKRCRELEIMEHQTRKKLMDLIPEQW